MTDQFTIDVPPPTISGTLHLGHVFSYAHMDFIARYQSALNGKSIVYPYCYDNNGLPTEKLALANNITGNDEIVNFSRDVQVQYRNLFNSIGVHYGNHYYDTFDDNARKLCLMSYQDLLDKGLLYCSETEYYYCPESGISVSQSEIDEEGRFERSGAKVQLKRGKGYFINMTRPDLLQRMRVAIDAINWKPEKFKNRLLAWLDQIKFDWSISRERKFGIPIPGDDMTFDTWFISSLSPQMAYASAHTSPESLSCPIFDVRFQAHDIIRTWALFTIVKSLYHNDQIPWKNVIVSGHALDPAGRKISKTAGNFVPPIEYVNKYTADGVRYWAAHSEVGTDTCIDEQLMEKGKRLVNKIKNAKRFIDGRKQEGRDDDYAMHVLQQWIEIKESFHYYMDEYDWTEAIRLLTDYFWNEFCSKHIEACKQKSCVNTLKYVFDEMLPCFEIFLPFVRQAL